MRSHGAPRRHVTPKIKLIRLAQQTCRSHASNCPKQGETGGSLAVSVMAAAGARRYLGRATRWHEANAAAAHRHVESPKRVHACVETSDYPLKLGDFAVG